MTKVMLEFVVFTTVCAEIPLKILYFFCRPIIIKTSLQKLHKRLFFYSSFASQQITSL